MKSVLIIEDDAALSEMYRTKFVLEKFSVITALDGQDGVDKMKSLKPDAVILDLLIPKVTGFDILKIAKNNPALNKIPIIVLSNIFADAEEILNTWGAKYFLLKSNTTPEDVVEKVKQLLAPAQAV